MLTGLAGSLTKSFWGLLIVAIVTSSNVVAATPNKKIAILFADFSERAGIVFVAKDQHFFEEQGLDSDVVQVRSGPVAISALAANEAQFYMASANAATLGAMASGLDLAFVAGLINKLTVISLPTQKFVRPRILKEKSSVCRASEAASGCSPKWRWIIGDSIPN